MNVAGSGLSLDAFPKGSLGHRASVSFPGEDGSALSVQQANLYASLTESAKGRCETRHLGHQFSKRQGPPKSTTRSAWAKIYLSKVEP